MRAATQDLLLGSDKFENVRHKVVCSSSRSLLSSGIYVYDLAILRLCGLRLFQGGV